ncbi:MAG TPA: SMP-30/gluconolactonase/LRE family protein [Cyclobacteriaceae bacterium]|nr:SMP-30/gluconolactonase/LRE family protein [Cyclobacteriaceae bacterium]
MKKLLPLAFLAVACSTTKDMKTVGTIERLDPALDAIISVDAKPEMIAEGYDWSEGPVWVESQKMLLFSDVPKNIVYKWTEEKGAEQYLSPSGFTGDTTRSQEPGSNGLLIDDQGRLVLCQHGDRRLSFMNADLASPATNYTTIADNYHGKKFNSPNDAVQGKDKSFYMTDPPYGLGTKDESDPEKQIAFQGVYKISADGKVRLLVDSITRPNGIGLSPDNKYLYIANSDPAKSRWYRFELGDTSVVSGSVFYDATNHAPGETGLPDGFKVDSKGNLFASGPGGVYIFSPEGKVLGRIRLEAPCANTALSPDEKWLFVTNDNMVLRVALK